MGDLVLKDLRGEVLDLIVSKAARVGQPVEAVAEEALLKGLLWSPAERTAYADGVRAKTPRKLGDDSTDIIRRLRGAT